MSKLVLSNEEMLLAESVARYYRQPEKTSYFDKEVYFEVVKNNPDVHFMALSINRRLWKKRSRRR